MYLWLRQTILQSEKKNFFRLLFVPVIMGINSDHVWVDVLLHVRIGTKLCWVIEVWRAIVSTLVTTASCTRKGLPLQKLALFVEKSLIHIALILLRTTFLYFLILCHTFSHFLNLLFTFLIFLNLKQNIFKICCLSHETG